MKHLSFLRVALTALVAVSAYSFAAAQSLQLIGHPGPMAADLFSVNENGIYVKNISGSTINVIAKREQQTLANDHLSYFCWDVCFGPNVTMGAPMSVAPGDTIKLFKSYLEANGRTGVSHIRYSFYNEANMADSVQYTFSYYAGVSGVAEGVKVIGNLYPNPATERLSVELQLPDGINPKLEVMNAIGRVVQVHQPGFSKGTATISTASLPAGVYYLRTISGSRTLQVQKFTVL